MSVDAYDGILVAAVFLGAVVKLRDLGDDELRAEAARLRESLFRLNFNDL